MRRLWKLTAILAPITLAALALGGYIYTRAHAAPTYRLANGIEITPVEAPNNELAEILDVKTFQFNVSFPRSNQTYNFGFHTLQNGKDVLVSALSGVRTSNGNQQGQITVTLAPLGSDIRTSDRLKYRVTYSHSGATGGTSSDLQNPFKGCQIISDARPVTVRNNALYLMAGSKNGTISPPGASRNEITLLLRVDAVTPNPHAN